MHGPFKLSSTSFSPNDHDRALQMNTTEFRDLTDLQHNRATPVGAKSPGRTASSLPAASGSTICLATRALPPHRPASSSAPTASAPSARSLPSARTLPAASSSRPGLVSATPANPVPLGSSRFLPSFSLASVNRNFLLGSLRNFSLGRDTSTSSCSRKNRAPI